MKQVAILCALVAVLALCSAPVTAKVQETESADGFVCDVCFFLVAWVEDKLASNNTENWIITEVDKVCNIFPGFLGAECEYLVAYYVPQIIQSLENRYPPLTICSKIGLCSALQARLFPEVDISRMGCAQCMFFASLSYSATIGVTDINGINTKLHQTCASIQDPSAHRMCSQFISRDGLVPLLQARKPPATICRSLGDCQSRAIAERARQYVLEHPFRPVETAQSSTECQLCQWIFSAYESWLSDGQTEAEIALFLSQLCNFFGTYAPQCDQLVRVYVPKVIQSYVERTTPPILCSSIGFCQLPMNKLVAHP
jgi:hypothetical protein